MAVISSPLAKSLQGGLIQRVSGASFGGGRGIGPVESGGVNSGRSEELLENNQTALSTVSSNLTSISQEISSLRNGIDSIASQIVQANKLEESAAAADEQYQKRLAERAIRAEGETQLENKIQAALSSPVQSVAKKVNGIFGNVGAAIQTLLTGWVTIQLVKIIDAFANKDIEQLKKISGDILKTFSYVVGAGGVLSLIKLGIGRITGLFINLAAKVGGFVVGGLFLKPFTKIVDAIKGAWASVTKTKPGIGGNKPPTSGMNPPTGPKKGSGPAGGLGTALGTAGEALSGNYIEAGLGAAAFLPGLPGKIAKGAFWVEQGLDLFGKGMIPESTQTKKDSPSPTPAATPQTPMMGENRKKEGEGEGVKPNTVPGVKIPDAKDIFPDSGASVSPGSAGASTSVTPQTPMTPSAASLSLGAGTSGTDASMVQGKSTTPSTEQTSTEITPTAASISPASTQTANMKAESLGPESKPQTTVIAQTSSTPSRPTTSGGGGAGTNTPSVRSSNPDNFYALYSQYNYNVVT